MSSTTDPLKDQLAPEEARGWETRIFRRMCAWARQQAVEHLEALEEALFARRPAGWSVVGFRERTLVTRFGQVSFRRRLYQDASGDYHLLLDEYLGLPANQAATPEMQALCTLLGSAVSCRIAARNLSLCLAGVLSYSTCWRLLQRTGGADAGTEAAEAEAVTGAEQQED